jgi:hypothetical protein
MMSCTASAAWSCLVSSPCCTEYGQRCGVVLSGRITTVAMSRSDRLSWRCTIETTVAAYPYVLQAPR